MIFLVPFIVLAGAGVAALFVADNEMEEQKEFVREIAKETEIILQVDNLEVENLVERQIEVVEPEEAAEEMPELE